MPDLYFSSNIKPPLTYFVWSSCISHTFIMSHWSSGLTVCFPPQRAMVCALGPGVQPTL